MPIRHEEIEPAIVIQIHKLGAPTQQEPRRSSNPGGPGDVIEETLALVVIELVCVMRKIRHKGIEKSIIVIIPQVRPHGRLLITLTVVSNAGFDRDVGERAVAIVPVQVAGRRIVSHKYVRIAVIIVVAEDHAKSIVPVMHVGDSGALGDLRERAITVVVEEGVGLARQAAWSTKDAGALEEAGGFRRVASGRIFDIKVDITRHVEV